ncbi:MAG: phage portal protein [Clostridia bacterium]
MSLLQRWKAAKARDEPPTGTPVTAGYVRADRYMTASEAIYAAVSRVALTFASIPIHLYKGKEIQKEHPMERLIAYAPNCYMTAYMFRQTMQACVGNEGNAYALIVPSLDDKLRVEGLDVIDPAQVTPTRLADTGELWYRVQPPLAKKTLWVHNSDMLVIRHMSANGERGIKPINVLGGTIQYDADIKSYTMEQLKNVNSSIVLNVPATGLNDARRREIVKTFLDGYRDSGRTAIVLDGGMTVNALNRTPVDSDVQAVENMTRNRVATVYGVPPSMMGDTTDKGFADSEQQMRELGLLTMLPIVCQWEGELDRKLLTWEMVKEGYHFRCNMDAMLRGDVKTMAEKHQKAIRGGWIKPNEARDDEYLPDDPDGDELLGARDLLPLRLIKQGATVKDSGR